MVKEYEVVIPAAGHGTRFGANKLLAEIGGHRVIDLAITPFLNDARCTRIILVAQSGDQFPWLRGHRKIQLVVGGETRHLSVKNGVMASHAPVILIHDGARPFLSEQILDRIMRTNFHFGSLVIPVRDSIIRKTVGGVAYLNRDDLFLVQTPQFFERKYLMDAYQFATGCETDELSMVVHAFPAEPPTLLPGDWQNLKITYPNDIKK